MSGKGYRDLEVWQKAMDLVVFCYEMTNGFPRSEMYGLSSQLRRAAVSIPANIAEGCARQYAKEFIQHLSIAYGSAAELETHVLVAERLGYVNGNEVEAVLDKASEIGKMLNGLRKSLQPRN